MLCSLEHVTTWVDEGSPVNVIYLELEPKGRDMENGTMNWIKKWLIDRRQRVVVSGEASNWKSVLSGVPHGLLLGHIIVLIQFNGINDLDGDTASKVLTFADDTKVFKRL